jgi:sugar phosphate isomerase/epimerase
VKLGTGNANFEVVFKNLKLINFQGIIIMQAARADNFENEIELVEEQFLFLKNCLKRWFL